MNILSSFKRYSSILLVGITVISKLFSEEPSGEVLKSGKDFTDSRPSHEESSPFISEPIFEEAERQRQQQKIDLLEDRRKEDTTLKTDDKTEHQIDLEQRGIGIGSGIAPSEISNRILFDKKSGLSGVLEAFKELLKRIVGIPTLSSSLSELNLTLERITKSTAELTSNDLELLQNQISNTSNVLNSIPKTAETQEVRAQLEQLVATLYGNGLTVEDILTPRTQLPRIQESLDWIKNPIESVRTQLAAQSSQLSKIEEESLINLNNPVRTALSAAFTSLTPRAGAEKSEFVLANLPTTIADVRVAVDTLNIDLAPKQEDPSQDPNDPKTKFLPVSIPERLIQFQDAYATLIASRTLVSTLLTAPVDAATREEAFNLLQQAKSNLKTISAINESLGIIKKQQV